MLATATTTDKHQGKDAFNVVPTLLLMGKEASSDVQRHIVRAIDNLNSHGKIVTRLAKKPTSAHGITIVSLDGNHWQDLFSDAYVYINKILEKNEKDDDTVKRAKSILAREKALKSSTELSKSNQEDNEQVSLDNDATAADEVDKVTEALEEVSLEVPNGGIIVTASSIEEDEDEDNINENRKAPKTSKNERKSKKNKQ
jgi:hypothetical protein